MPRFIRFELARPIRSLSERLARSVFTNVDVLNEPAQHLVHRATNWHEPPPYGPERDIIVEYDGRFWFKEGEASKPVVDAMQAALEASDGAIIRREMETNKVPIWQDKVQAAFACSQTNDRMEQLVPADAVLASPGV